jgi:hypothetical protein
MMSYPTVVLCRIDNKIWEKPLDNWLGFLCEG